MREPIGGTVAVLLLLAFGGGIGATFVGLRLRRLRQLGGAPTMRPAQVVINTIGSTAPLGSPLGGGGGGGFSTTRESATAPLAMNAAPIGAGSAQIGSYGPPLPIVADEK